LYRQARAQHANAELISSFDAGLFMPPHGLHFERECIEVGIGRIDVARMHVGAGEIIVGNVEDDRKPQEDR
jgi:hypothetical protein